MAPAHEKKDKKGVNGERRQRRAAVADSAMQEDQCHPRKIFIGGLSSSTTTQDLRGYFAQFGGVADAVVLQWPDGRSRGFGYVTFVDASASMAALQAQHMVCGRPVDVKRAVPGTNKLFIGGLPQNASAAELREHFEAFGIVSDAVVMIDPATGRSRGFGFVCFCPGQEGAAAMSAALEQYQSHRIRGKWIEVKSAAPPHKLGSQEQPEVQPLTSNMPTVMGAPAWPLVDTDAFAAPGPRLLPELMCHNALGEPQKVLLPRHAASQGKVPDLLGTPPGLDGMVTPRMSWSSSCDEPAGPIPWPSAATAALAPMMWPGLSLPDFDSEGLGYGDLDTSTLKAQAADTTSEPAASENLQKSLEQLLRLRLCTPEVGAA